MPEIEPCPFCGRTPAMRGVRFGPEPDEHYGIACQACGICIGWDKTKDEAIKRWNTRAKDD